MCFTPVSPIIGSTNPENIFVDEPVYIYASDPDPANTVINVDGQGPGTPWQVVDIASSGVILDGFTLTGTQVGVFAHESYSGTRGELPLQQGTRVHVCAIGDRAADFRLDERP